MQHTSRQPGISLAYEFLDGAGPVLVFCSGFGSDMGGTKAMHLWALAQARGQAMLRFDYAGHGASEGRFTDGCIGDWAADAAHIIETALPGRPLILIGSSMGGWIALLLGKTLGPRLQGLVLIAPAPDFTEILVRPGLSTGQAEELARTGIIYQPSSYGPAMPLWSRLLEDGRKHLVLKGSLAISCPVRVLHGMRDEDVPWGLSVRLAEQLAGDDVRLVFVKDAGHRLSRPADLDLLASLVFELLGQNTP